MLWIDLRNAIEGDATNYTCMLFRLLLKADSGNLALMRTIYPVECEMVFLYRNDCPYDQCIVDYKALEEKATSIVTH